MGLGHGAALGGPGRTAEHPQETAGVAASGSTCEVGSGWEMPPPPRRGEGYGYLTGVPGKSVHGRALNPQLGGGLGPDHGGKPVKVSEQSWP